MRGDMTYGYKYNKHNMKIGEGREGGKQGEME